MLDSYELPFGLKIYEIKEEPELMVLTSLYNYREQWEKFRKELSI